jgi:transposase
LLKAKPVTGRPSRLEDKQWQEFLKLLNKGANAVGFDTDRWTLPRIRDLLCRQFGVAYHPRSLGRKLHSLGWSRQVPASQARERDQALVEAWLKRAARSVKVMLGMSHSLCQQPSSIPSNTNCRRCASNS